MDVRTNFKDVLSITALLPFIILIEGFVSISIEIITIRQLLPVAGGNVIVTSLIIGIFLLFLALGYKRGGMLEKDLQKSLSNNFLIAALWLGLGLSYLFIIAFFNFIQKIFGYHVIYPLIAYLLFIIAPLIYILGQTIPITMNMTKHNKSVGMIGGDTMSLSTIGSFLGATVTSLVLMHYFGVAWTIFINYLLLFALFLILSVERKSFILWAGISIAATWFMYGLNIQTENNLFLVTNNYANYQILDDTNYQLKKGEKILSINNSLSSFTNAANQSFAYMEFVKNMLFRQMGLRNANILVLGAGGFTFSAQGDNGNNIVYVDIDKQLQYVVVPKFHSQINGKLVADDARHYVHTAEPYQYSVIIVDAYTTLRSIPTYLLTLQFMQELQKLLTTNGIAIFNIIANPTLSDPYSKRIDNTLRAVFKNCMVVPARFVNDVTNILYVCSNANNQKDKTIYSDNRNTATTDSFEW